MPNKRPNETIRNSKETYQRELTGCLLFVSMQEQVQ